MNIPLQSTSHSSSYVDITVTIWKYVDNENTSAQYTQCIPKIRPKLLAVYIK